LGYYMVIRNKQTPFSYYCVINSNQHNLHETFKPPATVKPHFATLKAAGHSVNLQKI